MVGRFLLLFALILAGCAPVPSVGEAPVPPPATALDAHIPRFARWPYQPYSREAAVQIALREWRAFGQPVVYPNTELPEDEEREEGLWQRVGEYWWLGLDPSWRQQGWTGIHDENGVVFPASEDGNYAWSAAFMSYVMRIAGAGSRFPYSETHSDYINAARRHSLGLEPGIALSAERVEVYAPQRGDLICYWRGRQPVSYDELPTGRFPAHCDIVVAIQSGYLDVIGGNVDNAVALRHIPVTADGHLAGPDGVVIDPDHHYFVVLRVEYLR
ncbi:MAG: DUF2272 domain-containing protein [Alphaproteobacteria bacterium]|nr:DUF2272 domain-containing protein [Alphaproteobacteria bacterium]